MNYDLAELAERPFRDGRKTEVMLTEMECEILAELSAIERGSCLSFRVLGRRVASRRGDRGALDALPERHEIVSACHRLRALGLAVCEHGLFDDQGQAAGSGYRLSTDQACADLAAGFFTEVDDLSERHGRLMRSDQ